MRTWADQTPTPKKKLEQIAKQILTIQCQHPSVRNHSLEEELLKKYEEIEEQNNAYWRQRSRIQWQEEGDRNTRFFHTVATNRRRHNLITMVQQQDGTLTGDDRTIRAIFLKYFKDLYCLVNLNLGPLVDQAHTTSLLIFEELNGSIQKTVPMSAHSKIIATPTYQEVKRTLFEMGPDKSPGPDGFTARFLQTNWHILGPTVVAQLKNVFEIGEVPEDWLRGHVTLIPKSAEPMTPADYRPISVGTILYRLMMKLVANRLRPHIKKVISHEQNAFLKGRNISDNIILVKEILHSFAQRNFKGQNFLLKVDINKAFDKLNWSFLQMAMKHLNIPWKIIHLMITSYSKAKITININGQGDGFLTPTQGLRQGCPMSPYIFIMSMEVLSRLLARASQRGMIQGVKVARTSPSITHAIYADDLILMGDTKESEVQAFKDILQIFGTASGLCINPTKSGLWFSNKCTENTILRVQEAWGARRVQGDERYLGVLIGTRGDCKRNGRVLLDKLKTKLAGWKSQMLSHAGRLVLIKSVLMSMPVYTMSLEMLPKKIVKDINSLLAKFFWGKTHKERYMSFIGWQKVCKPLEDGGLAVKDLQIFGEALFLKLVWELMADDDKLWVKVCKSKYYHVVGFWRAQGSNGGSTMWRQVIKMRGFFTQSVRWHLGNGDKVLALSQPWFDIWNTHDAATNADRNLKVNSLLAQETGEWDVQQLNRLFQPHQVDSIIGGAQKPVIGSNQEDKLIWNVSKSGRYSAKEGYKVLCIQRQGYNTAQETIWKSIWKWKSLAPKVKVFLWRLLQKGLPMAANIHSRIANFSPACQRCGEENEYEMHCLFFCNSSRQVWFASPLGLRVHELPLDITVTVVNVMGSLDEEGSKMFAHTMWEIWKERCTSVIEHKNFQPQAVVQRIRVSTPIQGEAVQPQQRMGINGDPERYEFRRNSWQVLTDASWDVTNNAGGGFVIYKNGKAQAFGFQFFQAQDPLHSEGMAVVNAISYFYHNFALLDGETVEVFSDSWNLVQAVNHEDTTDLASWRAVGVIEEIIQLLKSRHPVLAITFARREALRHAHDLANLARRNRESYQGLPDLMELQRRQISGELDARFFQRVTDNPP
ncbi:reverse transcriptase [Rhynchospora pubera]|uniref:Reverse transcriptase n=1 Tax=Rhynchospora pubera TaxID=906938 RepID=A0AAV8EYY1_9POAL|nr:reverse transcriptase [Rhynchospora pubera]